MKTPFLDFAHWCSAQITDWDRQDRELDDAMSLSCEDGASVDWDRITATREKLVEAKAREMGILPSLFNYPKLTERMLSLRPEKAGPALQRLFSAHDDDPMTDKMVLAAARETGFLIVRVGDSAALPPAIADDNWPLVEKVLAR